MLTRQDARYYSEQLHPAFAGYLHDGAVSQRDALATIFNLLIRGSLDPIWIDNSILKGIAGVRLMRRRPQYEFEQAILNKLFALKRELTAHDVGRFIKSGVIQQIITGNLNAIAAFPLVHNELKFHLGKHTKVHFSVNGEPVDTIQEATAFKRLLYRVLLPVFAGVGAFLVFLYFFFGRSLPPGNYSYHRPNFSLQIQGDAGGGNALLLTGAIFLAVIALIALSFRFSQKTVAYNFQDDVIPLAQKKYHQLYEFLQKYPLKPHRFTNQFLAYSIAFALDNSWLKDFGLTAEVSADSSPLT